MVHHGRVARVRPRVRLRGARPGDSVAATARDASALDDLRDQLDANVFGPLRVTRAVLPGMRRRGEGHLVQISSIGGVGAFAGLGAYHASKWALEALSESLAVETASFGIHVTIVEPGGYDTDWAGSSARRSTLMPAYDLMREQAAARRGAQAPGDPAAAARALLEIVDAPEPPLRVLFGAPALGIVRGIYERRLAEWSAWESLSVAAQGVPTGGRTVRDVSGGAVPHR